MAITAKRETEYQQYPHQYNQTTVVIGTPSTTVPHLLLVAAEQDIYIDSIYIRCHETGSDCDLVIRDAAAGVDGDTDTAATRLVDTTVINTLADETNHKLTLTESSATVTDPRVVRAGGALAADFTAATGTVGCSIYIRWRTHIE